jgi:hypothetical protein
MCTQKNWWPFTLKDAHICWGQSYNDWLSPVHIFFLISVRFILILSPMYV